MANKSAKMFKRLSTERSFSMNALAHTQKVKYLAQ